MNFNYNRKFGYGARSAALIAGVLLAVILLNVGMTALTQGFLWYGDMTADAIYTPTNEFMTRMGDMLNEVKSSGQEDVKVESVHFADSLLTLSYMISEE